MIEVATIPFKDLDSGNSGVAVVRFDKDCVAICLSLEAAGDIEVVLCHKDAASLQGALATAISAFRPTEVDQS